MQYPMLEKVLAEAEVVEADWKTNLAAFLAVIGLAGPAAASGQDFVKAIQKLDGKVYAGDKIQVSKGPALHGGTHYDVKVGDYKMSVTTDDHGYGASVPWTNKKGSERGLKVMEYLYKQLAKPSY